MRKDLTKEILEEAVSSSKSMAEAAKKVGCCGSTFERYAKRFGLWNPNPSGKGKKKPRKYKSEKDVFIQGKVPSGALQYYLKQDREWRCECCEIQEWQGKPLALEIHHKDGNHNNNTKENLQVLCPNCHAQTDTWRSRNVKGTSKHNPRVSDQELIEALKSSESLSQALQKVGLSGGSNYMRAYKLLEKLPCRNW